MPETASFTKRSFGSGASDHSPEGTDQENSDGQEIETEIDMEPVSTKAIIATVVLLVLALGCIIGSAGFAGGEPAVSEADTEEIYEINKDIRDVKSNAESLPNAKDAERNLVRALDAAGDVATLQNNYRFLARDVKAAEGAPDPALGQDTTRGLTPYFDPSVDAALLDPWYLLDSDATVDEGVGIPELFDSGFSWQAQVPSVINKDGTVSVSWLAIETRTAGDRAPAVLAWAQADYDMTRQVFTDVHVGTTSTGRALGLEVKH